MINKMNFQTNLTIILLCIIILIITNYPIMLESFTESNESANNNQLDQSADQTLLQEVQSKINNLFQGKDGQLLLKCNKLYDKYQVYLDQYENSKKSENQFSNNLKAGETGGGTVRIIGGGAGESLTTSDKARLDGKGGLMDRIMIVENDIKNLWPSENDKKTFSTLI